MASKPCSNLIHAVDPADHYHWRLDPKTDNWRTCDLQPCPHTNPLNSIAQPRWFPDGDTTASTPLPFAATPTPLISLTYTPSKPLPLLSPACLLNAFKANKDEGAVIAKPAVFKGDADNVARFLPMFRNWATEQKVLRIKAGEGVTPGDVGKLDHKKTIQSALSFCKGGEAGRWVANYLKQINTSTTDESVAFPFEGKWETFEKQFKVRFGSANKKADAIRELEQMKQGNRAVTLYCQDFRDAGAKTGLSDTNLMIHFQSGLNPGVKKLLVTMDLAQGDLEDLDALEDCSCRAERALEAEGFSTRRRTEIHFGQPTYHTKVGVILGSKDDPSWAHIPGKIPPWCHNSSYFPQQVPKSTFTAKPSSRLTSFPQMSDSTP
ncbi:hypothetical protein PQX77_013440 [Marasmius sp. AFHP31]|nr:hypothetical protein PQX77_013440 [Marasmius sp. AFHP31]